MCSSGRPLTRRGLLRGSVGLAAALAAGCSSERPTPSGTTRPPANPSPSPALPTATSSAAPAASVDPAAVAARATVPVLCWHQLRDWRPSDAADARQLFICPPQAFRAQLDTLVEDGWNAISPDDYLSHCTSGAALPPQPVILSFDDSQGSQIAEGLPQLRQRNLTATFFCMTVVLDKPDWMSRDDVRRLADAGMTVGAHTYDHHRADRYAGQDWKLQLEQPRDLLEKLVQRPVVHFAYPYGAWAPIDFPHLQSAGYQTAFQLSDKPLDPSAPLLTLRRTLVDSTWTGERLLQHLRGPA
ncbi:MAG: putative xylanase/chitin deacetylase [Frankiales bacterium]|nr:putative xylanase/chitin deacetylase [Frankiales bacterium]